MRILATLMLVAMAAMGSNVLTSTAARSPAARICRTVAMKAACIFSAVPPKSQRPPLFFARSVSATVTDAISTLCARYRSRPVICSI